MKSAERLALRTLRWFLLLYEILAVQSQGLGAHGDESAGSGTVSMRRNARSLASANQRHGVKDWSAHACPPGSTYQPGWAPRSRRRQLYARGNSARQGRSPTTPLHQKIGNVLLGVVL